MTAKDIATEVGCTTQHVNKTLTRLADEDGSIWKRPGAGEHGRTVYYDNGAPSSGTVDLTPTTDNALDTGTLTTPGQTTLGTFSTNHFTKPEIRTY